MALDVRYNFVTFTPDPWTGTAPVVYLKCGPITLRGGLQPSIVCATVPYAAVDALAPLGIIVGEITGRIELWYSHAPDSGEAADVVLTNWAIVDVEIERIGREPGEVVDKAITYRMSLADHRRAWVAPRGGILMDGRINSPPYASGDAARPNSELIGACLTAMGSVASIVADVDDVDAIEQLDWSGTHAPSELQRLLEHTGTVYAPLISGTAQIVTPGTVSVPTIPGDRLIRNVATTAVDRRAGIVVFTSCPAPRIYSFDEDAVSPHLPTWKYVVLDPATGRWVTEADAGDLGDGFAAAWSGDFDDVDEPLRAHYQAQLYRCIQLDPTKFPPRRVRLLAQSVTTDLLIEQPSITHASMLLRDVGGSFLKGTGGRVLAEKVIPEANVLIFPHALMKIATGAQARRLHLSGQEVCIPESQLKPTFSVEAWDGDAQSRDYGIYGALVSGGTVNAISRATAKSYLSGYRPNVSIFNAPDLVNVLFNGGATEANRNTEAMQARAQTYAASALGVSTPALRVLSIKGFYPVDLDAAVSEVTWDPSTASTTAICYGWHCTARTSGDAIQIGGVG